MASIATLSLDRIGSSNDLGQCHPCPNTFTHEKSIYFVFSNLCAIKPYLCYDERKNDNLSAGAFLCFIPFFQNPD